MTDSSGEHKHQYALAAAPLVAYFCMLTFEQGRYDFLGIPRDFVELPPQRIAQLGASTVLLLMFLLAIVFLFYHLSSSKNKVLAHLAKSFFYALFLIPLAYVATNSIWSMCAAAVISLFAPWVYADKTKPKDGHATSRRTSKEIAQDIGGFLMLSIFFVGIFFGFGKVSQRHETTYNVLASDRSRILVGHYNDRLIIKSFDQRTKKLRPGVSLIAGGEPLDVITMQIGPLKQ